MRFLPVKCVVVLMWGIQHLSGPLSRQCLQGKRDLSHRAHGDILHAAGQPGTLAETAG